MLLCALDVLLCTQHEHVLRPKSSRMYCPPPVTDNCPRYAPEKPEPHYKSVCTIGSGSPCSCASDQFEPSDCCTSEGKVDTSEMCNGEVLKFDCSLSLALSLNLKFLIKDTCVNSY